MRIAKVEVTVVEVPQCGAIIPYRSRLRSSSTTRSAIVRVATDEGLEGWGEHNVNFLEGVSAAAMQIAATHWLVGRDPLNLSEFHAQCPLEVRLKSGVELALWDIRGKALGSPVAEMLGGVLRPRVKLAACMGIQPYGLAGEIAASFVEAGYSTLKTKAGADIGEDVEMARGVRDAVGDRLKLRLDPNCGYTPQQAAELARRLEPYDLEYLEQPISADPLSDAVWLRGQSSVPIALNESVVGPESALRIVAEGAAEYLLPDTHIAGGIWPCVAIGQIAHAAGVPCIMHCGHDLGPKTAAMLHVAAACPAYSLANDSTYYALESDVLTEPFQIAGGEIEVPQSPGLGVRCDPHLLEKYRVDC